MGTTDDSQAVEKSCKLCPSRLSAEEAGVFFGKSIGAPMCAQFGHILGMPEFKPVQEEIVNKTFAGECKRFGFERPQDAPQVVQALVALPDPHVIQITPTDQEKASCTSCLGCRNYVQDVVVMDNFGFPAGLCSAKGKLILHGRQQIEAKGCANRRAGSPRRDIGDMRLMPTYIEARSYDPSPITAFLARQGQPIVDPTEYVSDYPVTDEESEAGIRAWRKISDPKGSGRATRLPIFRTDFFDEAEQRKIPRTGDDEHPEWYADVDGLVYRIALEWMVLDETPMLWGPAGVGKTELFRHLAWLMHLPFDRISITNSSQVEDLIGKAEFHPEKGTWFRMGRIPQRWQKPGVLLLDEPNVGPEDVWERIRPLTDNSKQMVLDEDAAQNIERDAYCFFGLAGNPAWDVRNIGAKEIGDADGSRLVHVPMNAPPRVVEKAILKRWCEEEPMEPWTPTEQQLEIVMDIAEELRALSDQQELPISWGVRHQIKVVRHLPWLGWIDSYVSAIGDKEPEVRQMVIDRVTAKVPDDGAGFGV